MTGETMTSGCAAPALTARLDWDQWADDISAWLVPNLQDRHARGTRTHGVTVFDDGCGIDINAAISDEDDGSWGLMVLLPESTTTGVGHFSFDNRAMLYGDLLTNSGFLPWQEVTEVATATVPGDLRIFCGAVIDDFFEVVTGLGQVLLSELPDLSVATQFRCHAGVSGSPWLTLI